jgi:hypothetical protein
MVKNQANDLLNELLKDARKYTFRIKLRRWIYIYDIETILQYLVPRKTNTKQTLEIMARFEVSFDRLCKQFNSKIMPYKAFKILVRTAQKSNML